MPAGCRGSHSGVRPFPVVAVALLMTVALVPTLTPGVDAAKVDAHGDLPGARVGAAAVTVGDGVHYVIGGRSTSYEFSDEIIRYDSNTGESTVVARLPPSSSGSAGRQAAAAVYTGSMIYVFGGAVMVEVTLDGQRQDVPQSSADIIEFNPADNSVRRLELDQLPEPVWGVTAEWVNGAAFIFGGLKFNVQNLDDMGQQDTIFKFEPSRAAGDRVSEIRSGLPYAVQDLASTVVDGNVWLFGGLAENSTRHPCPYTTHGNRTYQPSACASDRILSMQPRTGSVSLMDFTLPEGRQFAAAVSADGVAYVIGGRAQSGSALSSIARVDVAGGNVDVMFPQLPGGRYGMPATTAGQEVFIFGGRDSGQHSAGVRDVLRFDTRDTPPLAPRDLQGQPVPDEGRLHLDWKPPHYDGGAPVAAYRVYRAPVLEDADGSTFRGDEALVGTTEGERTFTDENARPGATYAYRVVAVNAAGESSSAAHLEITVAPQAPSAPEGVRVFAGDEHVILRWSPPESDGGAPVTQYRVYRGNQSTPIAFVPARTLEYRDEDVENNVTYAYRVSAENSQGEGTHTASFEVVPREVPNPPQEVGAEEVQDGVRVTWNPSGTTAHGWHVYKGTGRDDFKRLTERPLSPSEMEILDPDVHRGGTYEYAIAGVTTDGEEGPWSRPAPVRLIEAPGAPRNVLLEEAPGYVNLSWQPPRDLGGADAVSYIVTRTGPDGTDVIAAELEHTRYRDRTAYPGVTYAYTVKAFNGITGPESAAVEGAAQDRQRHAPVAHVTMVGATRVDVGEAFTLDASGSRDDGRVVRWMFDFGDGSPPLITTNPVVTHAFEREASFIVTLTVEDDQGLRSEEPATLTIDVGRAGMNQDDSLGLDGGSEDEAPEEPDVEPPGSKSGGFPIPAPGVLAALAAAAAVALARRRRA